MEALIEFVGATNKMFGSLPSEIGMMSDLEILRFPNIAFSGAIPSEIGLLKNLSRFEIRDTNVLGAIPTEIGTMDCE